MFKYLFVYCLSFTSIIIGQWNENCPELSEDKVFVQVGGKYKPASNTPNQYFRVLFVFSQFADETIENSNWPLNHLPIWANDLVDQEITTNYRPGTLSDYWKRMSHGNYDFIGTVYPDLVPLPSTQYYQSNGKDVNDVNQDVITAIDPEFNFTRYDNWKIENNHHVFVESNADGYVDMIILCYRNPGNWFHPDYAFATLGTESWTLLKDGKYIHCPGWTMSSLSSGITYRKALTDEYTFKQTIIHEFGHFLFGGGHNTEGGITASENNYRTFALSGWESERLGYLGYIIATHDGFTVSLGDYIIEGDVLKVPIPLSNPNSTSYFLVENHQRQSIYDQIIRGGSLGGNWNLNTTIGKGVYMSLIKDGNSFPCNFNYKCADGSWNWVLNGTINMPEGWPPVMPLTKRNAVNRNNGKSDRHPENIYFNGDYWEKWHDEDINGDYILTYDLMGDEKDAHNLGYCELFTPWSNPSTYCNGNTNLAIQLFSSYGSEITIKVYSTYNSCLELPPSKPQFLKVTPSINNHPLLTWASNIEDDMNIYKIYKYVTSSLGWQYLTSTNLSTYEDISENYCIYGQYCLEHDIFYKIKAVDTDLLESVFSDSVKTEVQGAGIEKAFYEEKNIVEYSIDIYPNPFNPSTTITYQIPDERFVSIKIFDILGREVETLIQGIKKAGKYSVSFDGSKLSSGIYIYQMKTDDFVLSKKMMLLK